MEIAIIGAGISGLTVAHLLNDRNKVTVFEKENTPGGLIRCTSINGNLFHICGGHVFNSKRIDVLDWFWKFFDKENDFVKTKRNSSIFMNEGFTIPYPIENYIYLFDSNTQKSIINDLLNIYRDGVQEEPHNFEEFLRMRFGDTLYQLYFKPYNEKIWKCDLSNVPLDWLEGKLPMPTIEEILLNNFNHTKEETFVHSTFWYEKRNGSQHIADQLAEGLSIVCNKDINKMQFLSEQNKWEIEGVTYDKVIFCGNIKQLPRIVEGISLDGFTSHIQDLHGHGTTTVFCEIDNNPYSWIYLPNSSYRSHRIICTGNFSPHNNNCSRTTASIEFTDEISKEEIFTNLSKIPLHPQYITHHYSQYSYPIQNTNTRQMILALKNHLSSFNLYTTGRFADWEYYNMDAAIGAAMDMVKTFKIV